MSKFAKCEYCHQEMTPETGCLAHGFENKQGILFVAAKVGEPGDFDEGWPVKHCHDCNAPKGTFHHPGCDAERCPVCGGLALVGDDRCQTCGAKLIFIKEEANGFEAGRADQRSDS